MSSHRLTRAAHIPGFQCVQLFRSQLRPISSPKARHSAPQFLTLSAKQRQFCAQTPGPHPAAQRENCFPLTYDYLYVIMASVFCVMTTAATSSRPKPSSRRITPTACHLRPTTRFLIDTPAIRKRRKSFPLTRCKFLIDTNCAGFGFKVAIFHPPVTYNLKPATHLSNRNSQELKTNVTR